MTTSAAGFNRIKGFKKKKKKNLYFYKLRGKKLTEDVT